MPQTQAEADIRGNDWSDAEHDRAVAFAHNQQQLAFNRLRFLGMLTGNAQAFRALEHRWLPLARSSPPYWEGP
jgi:hypothetical protein